MQPFPQPNDASDKILLRSTHWFDVWNCGRRTTTTAGPWVYYHLLAFGSGELIINIDSDRFSLYYFLIYVAIFYYEF